MQKTVPWVYSNHQKWKQTCPPEQQQVRQRLDRQFVKTMKNYENRLDPSKGWRYYPSSTTHSSSSSSSRWQPSNDLWSTWNWDSWESSSGEQLFFIRLPEIESSGNRRGVWWEHQPLTRFSHAHFDSVLVPDCCHSCSGSYSHIVTRWLHAHAWLKHNMKRIFVSRPKSVLVPLAMSYTAPLTTPGTCTPSLSWTQSSSPTSHTALSELQPCADLRRPLSGPLAEPPSLTKNVDLDEPISFLDHVNLGCTKRECKPNEIIIEPYREMFASPISAVATEKLPGWEKPHAKTVLRHGRTCSNLRWEVLRTGEQKDRTAVQSFKSLLGWSPSQEGGAWISGRIIRCMLTNGLEMFVPGTNWWTRHPYGQEINLLDPSPNWTGACDKRLARLISYIHHTSDYRQYCHVGNTAKHCRLSLFQDPDMGGDLEVSKSTSIGMNVYLEVAHLFPLVGCVSSKRQYPTVLQNQKLFRWMLDWEWTDYPLWTYEMWW